jgi:hypothetical protein
VGERGRGREGERERKKVTKEKGNLIELFFITMDFLKSFFFYK